jgi:predicted ATPase
LSNFKSILADEVRLQPFTVVVGANGSGKSNLIKSLEFLGLIPRTGLSAAVSKFGGFHGMAPRALPQSQVARSRVAFKFRTILPGLENYPDDAPQLAVEHSIDLAHSEDQIVRLAQETIRFHQPLAIAQLTATDPDLISPDEQNLYEPSTLTVIRGPLGGLRFEAAPPFGKEPLAYLEWFGVPFFLEEGQWSQSAFNGVLAFLETGRRGPLKAEDRLRRRFYSYLNPEISSALRFSLQARMYQSTLGAVRRYDLLLGELRDEQQMRDSRQLSTSGNNMPSVLRHLWADHTRADAQDRILNTMSAISPHVSGMTSASLRTGKEFVEFLETQSRRPVESWESSDGTLRTLAILLALETSPAPSTILIEEPELNLHPWAVRILVDHMRDAIKTRNVQVIVTTHSQQVLEGSNPEEVLVATRNAKDGTRFKTLSEVLPGTDIHIGEIGELWVKGLLGGVPSYSDYA